MLLERELLTRRPRVRHSAKVLPLCRGTAPVTAVLGAGHGGLALAAQLALAGFTVNLWNRSPGRLAPVSALNGIFFSGPETAGTQMARPQMVTCQVADAVAAAEVILVAVPASGHRDIARRCAPYLRDGQAILLLPGRTGGALEFLRALRRAGCSARLLVGEAQSFPFASRSPTPATATIHRVKHEVPVAAMPAWRTGELLALCRPLLPMLTAAPSVLHTSFENMGCVLHPGITLGNRRRIAAGVSFLFYCEGVTPAVAATLSALDAERCAVASAYGVEARSLASWLRAAYGRPSGSLAGMICANPGYEGIRAPTALDHRYLWEDVPTGLVPISALGEAAGVPTPACDAAIATASRLLRTDFRSTGRSLSRLGLAGLPPGAVLRLATAGLDTEGESTG